MRGLRVLVTNDDGIHAPGLRVLAAAIVAAGYDVVVAAPRGEASGSGAAIGKIERHMTIDAEPVVLAGLEQTATLAVGGPPGLIALAARLGAFGPSPDVVVAGINPGPNVGRAVLHSGTVGAALTAANFGRSGLAVSMATRPGPVQHWATGASLAVAALAWLAERPAGTVVNLNAPNRTVDELEGVRWASLAPFGHVQAALDGTPGEPRQVEISLWGEDPPADSDAALIDAGWATVTLLEGITAEEPAAGLLEALQAVGR